MDLKTHFGRYQGTSMSISHVVGDVAVCMRIAYSAPRGFIRVRVSHDLPTLTQSLRVDRGVVYVGSVSGYHYSAFSRFREILSTSHAINGYLLTQRKHGLGFLVSVKRLAKMTVITKAITEKKASDKMEQPLFVEENATVSIQQPRATFSTSLVCPIGKDRYF